MTNSENWLYKSNNAKNLIKADFGWKITLQPLLDVILTYI